mgnify:CR=1 FL=1
MRQEANDLVARTGFAAVCLLLNLEAGKALEIARENYMRAPGDGVTVSTYAFALHLQGRTREGLNLLEKLKTEELQKPGVALYYGVLMASAGQAGKAKPYLDIASHSPLLPEEKTLLLAARRTLPSAK